MSEQLSRGIIDAIHLGTGILGWYCALYSPTPNDEAVARSIRAQLDVCGLSGVTLPEAPQARRTFLDEVVMRLSRIGKPKFASAVRLGWVLGLSDETTCSEDPETLKGLLRLADEVGIAEQSVMDLIAERKSIRQPNQAEVLVRHIESWLRSSESEAPAKAGLNYEYDVFISHASEDKDTVARPLYTALVERGAKVWFDEATLELGDSLRRKIDDGLARCRFGIVILSPHFLRKQWPQRELDGLVARETASAEKAILPVWHDLSVDILMRYSPTLADRLAAQSKDGIPAIANQILRIIGR